MLSLSSIFWFENPFIPSKMGDGLAAAPAERERLRALPGREGEAQVGEDVRHGPVLRRGVPPVDLG